MKINAIMRMRLVAARLAVGAVVTLLAGSGGALAAPCTGPGAPATTQTQCLTAVQIPGNPIKSFDISWVNPERAEYYLSDRSNAGVDIVDTESNAFKRTIGGFVGIVLNLPPKTGVDNSHSGPDGVTSHGRWLYAGDGNSTLHVIDLNAPAGSETKQVINTGGATRLDEMALTTDGQLLLAANNAEDPPFATLFDANGDSPVSDVTKIITISVDATIIPPHFGLSLEQPAWDPKTARFYTSIPVIAENPPGCNYGQLAGAITCDGGLLVTDPAAPTAVEGAFDPATNTGVVALHACSPNGATVGVHDNVLLGCTPMNNPSDTTTLVINAATKNYANIGNITGADEVWFNKGDKRYYTASAGHFGVIDGTSVLIEVVPSATGSHSIAADSKRNKIFVPEAAPKASAGPGGDLTGISSGVCGGNNGCVAVYFHDVDQDSDEDDAN